jgi:dihydrofolate reductase
MPDLIGDIFVSVDGSSLGTRSPGYFGYFGPDLDRWIQREQAAPYMDVMGRKTYELLAGLPEQHRDASWETMAKKPTLVFSRTLERVGWPGAELCSAEAVEEIAHRKRNGDHDLRTVGSLSLLQQFLNAGLLDRLRIMVFPLAVGESGAMPVFDRVRDLELHLVAHSILDGRIVLLEYRPGGPPPYVS